MSKQRSNLTPKSVFLTSSTTFKCTGMEWLVSHSPSICIIDLEFLIFPGGSDGKESAYSAGDLDSIPGSGRSPGEGNSNPLQYSCLDNSMDRGAWRATVHGVTRVRHN